MNATRSQSRSHAPDFWADVAHGLRQGSPVYAVLTAANSRHSPGTRGAKMAVFSDGQVLGTIGGGAMEADIIDEAGSALRSQTPVRKCETLVHRKRGPGKRSGLICAGEQTNVHFVFDPETDLDVLDSVTRRKHEDAPGQLILRDSGCSFEHATSPFGAPCELRREGDGFLYREELLNLRRAAIFGGGHVGLAVSSLLTGLGYVVTTFDTRADVFTMHENVASRHKIVVDDYAEAASRLRHPALTHALVMTADLPSDVRALTGIFATPELPFPFIGVMGASAKLEKIFEALRSSGVTASQLDRVHAPIGLPMVSGTPREIAVSTAAQILQLRPELFAWEASATASSTPEEGGRMDAT